MTNPIEDLDILLPDLLYFAAYIMNLSEGEVKYYASLSDHDIKNNFRTFIYPTVQYKKMDYMFKKILNYYLIKMKKPNIYQFTRITITNYGADGNRWEGVAFDC